jgi:NYN domain
MRYTSLLTIKTFSSASPMTDTGEASGSILDGFCLRRQKHPTAAPDPLEARKLLASFQTTTPFGKSRGFEVRRGYLGARGRSKQDDAYLIRDMTATLYEKSGPSTIVLVAGDADYMPPLELALKKGWRAESMFIDRGVSVSLEAYVHEFRTLVPTSIQHLQMRGR